MANTGAAIVDRVLPDVPVRQACPRRGEPERTQPVESPFVTRGEGPSATASSPGPAGSGAATAVLAPVVIALASHVLSVRHWDRLLSGLLHAATSRIDRARLLRRTFDLDVLQCPRCRGRLRVLAVITEREPVVRILSHLGLPTEASPLARARDPSDELDDIEPPRQLELGQRRGGTDDNRRTRGRRGGWGALWKCSPCSPLHSGRRKATTFAGEA